MAANSTIHRAIVNYIDEDNELAYIKTYSYDAATDVVKEGRAIAFRKAGNIQIKILENWVPTFPV